MRQFVYTVHIELTHVPSACDIDGPATVRDLIDGGPPFGDWGWKKETWVNSGYKLHAFGGAGKQSGHRQAIQGRGFDLLSAPPPALRNEQMAQSHCFVFLNELDRERTDAFGRRGGACAIKRPVLDLRSLKNRRRPCACFHTLDFILV